MSLVCASTVLFVNRPEGWNSNYIDGGALVPRSFDLVLVSFSQVYNARLRLDSNSSGQFIGTSSPMKSVSFNQIQGNFKIYNPEALEYDIQVTLIFFSIILKNWMFKGWDMGWKYHQLCRESDRTTVLATFSGSVQNRTAFGKNQLQTRAHSQQEFTKTAEVQDRPTLGLVLSVLAVSAVPFDRFAIQRSSIRCSGIWTQFQDIRWKNQMAE